MDQRKKEDKLMNDLKDPDLENSREIAKMINDCNRLGHKVWLATDWHLWLREEKDKPDCHKRSDFNQILNCIRERVGNDDLLIYLGDLVDGEFQDKNALKTALLSIGKKMVLVKGNNDLFTDDFYKSCGFKYVVQSFKWNNCLFTHVPVDDNKCDLNIHGHLHGFHKYWIPYSNQIDVAWLGGRKEPVHLKNCMLAQPKYSKIVKVEPEHFGEHAILTDVFTRVFVNNGRVYDPFPDDYNGA